MTERVTIIIDAIDKASKVLDGTGAKMTAWGGNVRSAGTTMLPLTAAIGAAAAGVGVLAGQASSLAGVRNAFNGISSDGEAMLASLEAASNGIVSQRDLMTSYNKASQLVSSTFADTLPDAMGSLNKVALATGQDMGFLLDSLVTGVGRLSPMILDNLGVQVDLTAAYDDYAASIGKVSDDLTKQEQQTALTNQVLELLARNTEKMPDASNPLGQTTTSLVNMKDELATRLMPALMPAIGAFTSLAETVLPPVIDVLGWAAEAFASLPQGAQMTILGLIALAAAAGPVLIVVGTLVSSVGSLMSAGAALGTLLSGPAVAGVLTTVGAILTGPVLLGIGAVIAAGALLYAAWNSNFGGIRDIAAAAWESVLGWFDLFKGLFTGETSWGDIGVAAGRALVNGFLKLSEWDARIKSFFLGLPGKFVTYVRGIDWSAIGAAIIELIRAGLDFDTMISGALSGISQGFLGGAAEFGGGLVSGIRSGISDATTNNNGANVQVNYNDYSGGGAANAALLTQSYEQAYSP